MVHAGAGIKNQADQLADQPQATKLHAMDIASLVKRWWGGWIKLVHLSARLIFSCQIIVI